MFIYKVTERDRGRERERAIYVGYLRVLRIYEFKCGTLQPRLFPLLSATVALKFMADVLVVVIVVVIITC